MYKRLRETLDKDLAVISERYYNDIKYARDPDYTREQVMIDMKRRANALYFCVSKTCQAICDVPVSHPIVIRAFMAGVTALFSITWKVLFPGKDVEIVYAVCDDFLKEPSKILPSDFDSVDPLVDEWARRLGLVIPEPPRVPTPPHGRVSNPNPEVSPAAAKLEIEGLKFIQLAEARNLADPHSIQALIDQARLLQQLMKERKEHLQALRNRGGFTQDIDHA